MGLYYDIRVIRLFLAAFSSTRLIILQGISGTGKTSLPYAWGKFMENDTQIASVQPSWRDRSELFGYFNEFTKRFSETEVLKRMYEATYTDKVYLTILDEMNIGTQTFMDCDLENSITVWIPLGTIDSYKNAVIEDIDLYSKFIEGTPNT